MCYKGYFMNSLQNFLFIFQIILSVLLIFFVLLQQTDEDSLSGIGAGGANAKMLSKRTLESPISKMTMILFIIFMCNSLLLATLSARTYNTSTTNMENFIEDKVNKQKNK